MSVDRIVTIFLEHPEPGYTAEAGICQDDPDKGRVGCGATITFYRTSINQKRMPFDGPPIVVRTHPRRRDGALLADVSTKNVHFATCAKRPAAKSASVRDALRQTEL